MIRKIKANREIIGYGLVLAILFLMLRWLEFRFIVISHHFEVYAGIIAVIFMGLGIWVALNLAPKPKPGSAEAQNREFQFSQHEMELRKISRRELDVLELIAKGMSNKEIGETLFISLNTVKSHSSRLFEKLEAKNRTQAVEIAKKLSLLP